MPTKTSNKPSYRILTNTLETAKSAACNVFAQALVRVFIGTPKPKTESMHSKEFHWAKMGGLIQASFKKSAQTLCDITVISSVLLVIPIKTIGAKVRPQSGRQAQQAHCNSRKSKILAITDSLFPSCEPHPSLSCETCPICLDTISQQLIKTLPCNHYYHAKCIDPWFEISLHCPMCKADVLPSAKST